MTTALVSLWIILVPQLEVFAGADSPGGVARNLDERVADAQLGGQLGGIVVDAKSGRVIWDHGGSVPLIPASTTKLLTAVSALTVLGPEHRVTTRVVYGDGRITVIGAGDRLLTRQDLVGMATSAAAWLRAVGALQVEVAVDDGLFPDPAPAQGWGTAYGLDVVAPIRSLVVDERKTADTALDAGQEFAHVLQEAGIAVAGPVGRRRATDAEPVVASHTSPALAEFVYRMLKVSDSDIAETLLRLTALGVGREATFEAGAAVVREVLGERYGLPLDGVHLHDGSGLSRDDRLSVGLVAAVLGLVLDSRNESTLSAVREGLPRAGESGSTLGIDLHRFDDPNSSCAVGSVFAKTGTLTGVTALSGITKGSDGMWKVFVFIHNGVNPESDTVRNTLDGLAATVNGCWG